MSQLNLPHGTGKHVVSPEEEKERLQWEWCAEKECFKPGMNEWVGDGKLIIISMTVSSISLRSVVAVRRRSPVVAVPDGALLV